MADNPLFKYGRFLGTLAGRALGVWSMQNLWVASETLAAPPTAFVPSSTAGNQWFGEQFPSSMLCVISTTAVRANALIHLTGRTWAASGGTADAHAWAVMSINPGVSFSVGPVASIGVALSSNALVKSHSIFWQLTNRF